MPRSYFRLSLLTLMFVGIADIGIISPAASAVPATYDPNPWLQDLDETRMALATKYANLDWVVLERETDLSALFSETKAEIKSASSDVEARAAFDRLARKLGDLHVRFRWSAEPSASVPNANCEALGYDARMQGPALAALMPGYLPLTNTLVAEFPAGIVQVADHKVGVLKIGLFSPQGFPDLCTAALAALQIKPDTPCDDKCADRIEAWTSDRMTSDLRAQLGALKALGAEVLLVDVADNGGGTEWAEAAARMVTAIRLKSERMGFVRGTHWSAQFLKEESELRAAARVAKGDDKTLLMNLADKVQVRLREAETPCDSAPLWSGDRPACRWLGDGFYASGLLGSDADLLHGKRWASIVFKPAKFNFSEGVWNGPLIVLINGGTGSAAAQFAAVLQDNHAAVVIGSPTVSAGCGHTDGGTPTTLKHSGGVLELPDCARFRTDGSNEVMGIQPDVLVGLSPADGPHRRGIRVSEKLPEAITRALQTQTVARRDPANWRRRNAAIYRWNAQS